MPLYSFTDAPGFLNIKGQFDASCTISLSVQAERAIQAGTLRFSLAQIGPGGGLRNVRIDIRHVIRGVISLGIGGDDATVEFGDGCVGHFNVRLWRQSTLIVGRHTSANGVRITCDLSKVIIGSDCMFSDDILIQSADQHGIVDLASGEIVNNRMRNTVIEDHVWLGRQCTVMPDVTIGAGAIAATGAIITSNVPPTSICAGVPARIIRTGVTWSRSPTALDRYAAALVHAQPLAASSS